MGTKDLQILEIGRENFFIFKKLKHSVFYHGLIC